jgi:two-component system invasion response regulator UvrY
MEKKEITVVLADHQELVRCGLRRLLDDVQGLRVIGEAATGEELVDRARTLGPQVVLMDARIPGIGGLEATRRVTRAGSAPAVVVITRHVDDPLQSQYLQAGASGCLTKHSSLEEIADAVRVVAGGERYISADIARQMALTMLPGNEQSPFDRLSGREVQVLMMVAQGHNVHTISERLCLSSKTVSTYRYRLFEKLGVVNDVELTRLAIRHGVVGTVADV